MSLRACILLQWYTFCLSDTQPAELHHLGVTLYRASHVCLNPNHVLHGQLHKSQNVSKGRLKSKLNLFVPATHKLLDSLSELSICVAQWTNKKWNKEYSKSMSVIHAIMLKGQHQNNGYGFAQSILGQAHLLSF